MNAILMESAGMSWTIILVYVVFIVGLFWLMGRPQKKEKKRLEALVGVVPGLLKAEVNTGFAGADVILYTEGERREALAVYADHPAHCKVKEYVHSVICARTACDWDA